MAAIYNPRVRLVSTDGPFACPWLHMDDGIADTPLESDDGYSFDTGRQYAYRRPKAARPEPGQVDSDEFDDFFSRVSEWENDTSIYAPGCFLPQLVIVPGSPNYVGSEVNGPAFFPGPINVLWKSEGRETVTPPVIAQNRMHFRDNEQFLPIISPENPGDDMDFTLLASTFLDYGPMFGPLTANCSIKFLGSQALQNKGASFLPYEFRLEWRAQDPDTSISFGGGWTTIYRSPSDLGDPGAIIVFDGTFITATFRSNKPQFGSTDSSTIQFNAYSYNWNSADAHGGIGYSIPTTTLSGVDDKQPPVLIVPKNGGYFEYKDPTTGDAIIDMFSGRRVDSSPMPMTMAP